MAEAQISSNAPVAPALPPPTNTAAQDPVLPIPPEEIIVIDAGSGYVKAGMAHETAPSAVFPAIVGRPR